MIVSLRAFSCLFALLAMMMVQGGPLDSTVSVAPLPMMPSWMQAGPTPLRRHASCECGTNVCGCCAQFLVKRLLFRQQGCLNVTYEPSELALTMDLLLSNTTIFQASISGRNPPPLCIPVPQFPVISICIKLHSLQTIGQDFLACLDLELRLQGITLLVFSFDCLLFGPSGLTVVKPTTNQTDGTLNVGIAMSSLLAAITNKTMGNVQQTIMSNDDPNFMLIGDSQLSLNQTEDQNVNDAIQIQNTKINSTQIFDTMVRNITTVNPRDVEQTTKKVESTSKMSGEKPTSSTDK